MARTKGKRREPDGAERKPLAVGNRRYASMMGTALKSAIQCNPHHTRTQAWWNGDSGYISSTLLTDELDNFEDTVFRAVALVREYGLPVGAIDEHGYIADVKPVVEDKVPSNVHSIAGESYNLFNLYNKSKDAARAYEKAVYLYFRRVSPMFGQDTSQPPHTLQPGDADPPIDITAPTPAPASLFSPQTADSPAPSKKSNKRPHSSATGKRKKRKVADTSTPALIANRTPSAVRKEKAGTEGMALDESVQAMLDNFDRSLPDAVQRPAHPRGSVRFEDNAEGGPSRPSSSSSHPPRRPTQVLRPVEADSSNAEASKTTPNHTDRADDTPRATEVSTASEIQAAHADDVLRPAVPPQPGHRIRPDSTYDNPIYCRMATSASQLPNYVGWKWEEECNLKKTAAEITREAEELGKDVSAPRRTRWSLGGGGASSAGAPASASVFMPPTAIVKTKAPNGTPAAPAAAPPAPAPGDSRPSTPKIKLSIGNGNDARAAVFKSPKTPASTASPSRPTGSILKQARINPATGALR